MMLAVCLSHGYSFFRLRKSLVLSFTESFLNYEQLLNFIKCFSESIENITWFLFLYSVNTSNYIDWLLSIEPILHPYDTRHLVMNTFSFFMYFWIWFTNMLWRIFVSLHEEYWSVILFSYNIIVRLFIKVTLVS